LVWTAGSRYGYNRFELLRFPPRRSEPVARPVCGLAGGSPLPCRTLAPLAYSPDGSLLAGFADQDGRAPGYGDDPDPQPSIWILTPDGVRVESHALPISTDILAWSPDGSAFLGSTDSGVGVLERGGTMRELVAPGAVSGDWCANGRVVVVRYGELHVVEPDGRLRRLTWRGAADPSCSPDGRRVAFTRYGPEGSFTYEAEVWTIRLAGGRARRLTTRGYDPAWSPDGRQVAFLRELGKPGARPHVTHLYRLGLKRLVVRRVSRSYLMSNDTYHDESAYGLAWRPVPRAP
jgi:hypothetical protein